MMDECRDCSVRRDAAEMYFVVPPGVDDTAPEAFWVCTFCWDRLIGLATMQAIR